MPAPGLGSLASLQCWRWAQCQAPVEPGKIAAVPCHRTVAYRPGTLSEVLAGHHRRVPETVGLRSGPPVAGPEGHHTPTPSRLCQSETTWVHGWPGHTTGDGAWPSYGREPARRAAVLYSGCCSLPGVAVAHGTRHSVAGKPVACSRSLAWFLAPADGYCWSALCAIFLTCRESTMLVTGG